LSDNTTILVPDWPVADCVHAMTTLSGQGDLALEIERSRLVEALGAPVHWLRQTHGTDICWAEHYTPGVAADAWIAASGENNCFGAVLTADCLPILLCAQEIPWIAVIHAGWRGLAGGIITRVVESYLQTGQASRALLVWLGPTIGPCHFEVKADVYTAFLHQSAENSVAFQPYTASSWQADLYTLARIAFNRLGVDKIWGGHECTFDDPSRFYSYRRDQGITGRMATVIGFKQYDRSVPG
jgi:YfiH family protein